MQIPSHKFWKNDSVNKLRRMLRQPSVPKMPFTKRHTSVSELFEISQMYARTQHEQMSSRNLFLRVKPQKRHLTWLKSLCKTAHSRLVTSCCLYTHCWCSSCSVNPILSSPRTHTSGTDISNDIGSRFTSGNIAVKAQRTLTDPGH